MKKNKRNHRPICKELFCIKIPCENISVLEITFYEDRRDYFSIEVIMNE